MDNTFELDQVTVIVSDNCRSCFSLSYGPPADQYKNISVHVLL